MINELLTRVGLARQRPAYEAPALTWHAQHDSFPPRKDGALIHYARSEKGTFEISALYWRRESEAMYRSKGIMLGIGCIGVAIFAIGYWLGGGW